MSYLKHKAIQTLYPDAVLINGDDAFDVDGNPVSYDADAVATKQAELQTAENLDNLRAERNTKLAESDWIVIKEREEGGSVPNFADWKTYRQALRDITKTYKSLDTVKWPTTPTE